MSSNSIERNDVNIDLVISKVDEPCAQDKRSGLFLFVFLLFIILTLTTLTTVIFMNLTDLKQEFQMKEKRIVEEQRKNDRLSKQIQHLQLITNGTTRELEKAVNQGTRQNITIEQLNNQLDQQREEQLKNQRMNEELHEELLRSFDEQQKQNETIEKLTHQCRSRSVTKANSIATAITTTTGKREELNILLIYFVSRISTFDNTWFILWMSNYINVSGKLFTSLQCYRWTMYRLFRFGM